MMQQHAMDPFAFARPPPLGFFGAGFSFARQPGRLRPPPPGFSGIGSSCARLRPPPPGFLDLGSSSCARPAVPARLRPPPPGFSHPRKTVLLPPSPSEATLPPKLKKRAAPPVSTAAADSENHSTKRQRLCPDYVDDIDANLRLTERSPEERPRADYLTTVQQDRVSPSARASLVEWMDAFVRRYDLADGTLHRAVAYVDRALSVRAMNTHAGYELRLLGAAAVFVAAKYEDRSTVLALDADKVASYGGFATRKEVLDMERHMVAALGYQLGGPTAHTFVGHFTRYAEGEEELEIQRVAHRLADRSLLDYACLRYLPSGVVAASAIFIARFAVNPQLAWNEEMRELTGYKVLDLAGCMPAMYSFSQLLVCNPSF